MTSCCLRAPRGGGGSSGGLVAAAGGGGAAPAGGAYDIVLSSGSAEGDRDFGIHRDGTISGHLFTDRDNDGGPQASGENDQPGRTAYVDENENGAGGDE